MTEEQKKLVQKAECTIHVSGNDLHASAVDENMYAAIDRASDKLVAQIRRHKDKLKHNLEKEGITNYYGIAEYFNKSAIKFQNKLNFKHEKLILSIVLFKKWTMNFELKKYSVF